MLTRLAGTCFRHRWLVASGWVILLVVLVVGGMAVGSGFDNEFGAPPGTESETAVEIMERNGFAARAGAQAQVVFQAEQGVDDPAVRAAIEALVAEIDATVVGASTVSPYDAPNQASPDGTIAYVEVNLPEQGENANSEAGSQIRELAGDVDVPGLRIELGGEVFLQEEPPTNEVFGLIGAVIILLVAFGSVLAMVLPIGVALFGIGSGVGLIEGLTSVIAMPSFTIAAAAMIGIGVGIDYALLIVTRYRSGLARGLDSEAAISLALDTAGRSVLFAGTTVVISLLGLMFMGIDMIRGMAIAASLAVLMTMLASVTLLPAALAIVGRRIDALGLPWRNRGGEDDHRSIWYRWSRVVQHHPWPAALAGFAFLVVLTLPLFSMRLGFADAGNRPESDTTRQAYDLLSEAFGPGSNGPLILAAELPGEGDLEALRGLAATLDDTPGVAFASEPIVNAEGDAAIVQVVPTGSPQDEETSELVTRLRDEVIPPAMAGSTATVAVGGFTAAGNDFAAYIGDRMPIFFGAVLLLSFLLLMAVFRSVLVPVKAVIMNLLSIGAAYGILVAIFQWGFGASLLGVGKEGPIEAWAPMMLFAVVFGLSMDYEVFLLSRIREEYDRTGDNASAVADGLAATGRVITAAAAIMVVVFASFALGDERALTLLGTGLALAIFLDATVVRMVLVPATMEILGDRNWWIPRWIDRVLPTVHVEPPELPEPAPAAGAD